VQSHRTTRCPACGGEVHAIAGRCKHCKHDLVQFRAQQALRELPQQAPPRPGPQQPINGTPPAGMPQAARAPQPQPRPQPQPQSQPQAYFAPIPRRRRWPIWVGGAALFLLGLSAGVMIERWHGPAGEQTSAVTPASAPTPEMVPAPMPSNPLMPSNPTPVPPSSPPSSGSASADDVTAFIDRFGRAFCDKAIQCGLFEESNRALCESAVSQSRDPNAGAKLAAGDCNFDPTAADRCLSSITGASCDPTTSTDQMATLLATSMLECERAYSCH
jgi:hypothetical protein